MRDVYNRSSLQGFQSPSSASGGGKIESVTASDNGRNVFVGTSEGAILRYSCIYQQAQGGSGKSICIYASIICSFV